MKLNSARVTLAAFVVLTLFWAICIAYVFNGSLGSTKDHSTALNLPGAARVWPFLRSGLPEGWGFFTKSPRDDDFYIYRVGTRGLISEFRGPVLRADNIFGLSRYPRGQGAEYGLLIQSLPASLWATCSDDVTTCTKKTKNHSIINSSSNPLLCGDLVMMQQPPVPWAWAKFRPLPVMPMKVIKVTIQCKKAVL